MTKRRRRREERGGRIGKGDGIRERNQDRIKKKTGEEGEKEKKSD